MESVAEDDFITFKISGSRGRVLCCRVRGVKQYATFAKMLLAEGTQHFLPGQAQDPVEGAAIYHSFCNRQGISYRELEKSNGAVAITVEALG